MEWSPSLSFNSETTNVDIAITYQPKGGFWNAILRQYISKFVYFKNYAPVENALYLIVQKILTGVKHLKAGIDNDWNRFLSNYLDVADNDESFMSVFTMLFI